MKAIIVGTVLLFTSHCALADDLSRAADLATVTCNSIEHIERHDSAQVRTVGLWVDGYLHGVSERLLMEENLVEDFDAVRRRMWISAYCANHPSDDVLDVARAMTRFIRSGGIAGPQSIRG
ncbi:hypothetical protein [Aquipseudomonas campi]